MSFEPIPLRKSKGASPVHVALRKNNNSQAPKVCFSIAADVLEALGVSVGDSVKPMLGSGYNAGKVRFTIADMPGTDSLVINRVYRGARGVIYLHPWMDYRGVRLPATPCLYRVQAHDFLEVELPQELAELPPMVAGASQ